MSLRQDTHFLYNDFAERFYYHAASIPGAMRMLVGTASKWRQATIRFDIGLYLDVSRAYDIFSFYSLYFILSGPLRLRWRYAVMAAATASGLRDYHQTREAALQKLRPSAERKKPHLAARFESRQMPFSREHIYWSTANTRSPRSECNWRLMLLKMRHLMGDVDGWFILFRDIVMPYTLRL